MLSRKYEALWTDGEDAWLRYRSAGRWSPILSKPTRMAPILVWPAPSWGLIARTVERWSRTGEVQTDARLTVARPAPAHKLSEQEHQRVLDVCHGACFAGLPPAQILQRLADEGNYLASESSFYCILGAL